MILLIRNVTYSSVDIELQESANKIKKVLKEIDAFEIKQKYEQMNEFEEYAILLSVKNPKLLCIIRDEYGEILETNINYISNDTFENFDFDDDLIDTPYVVNLDDEYYYKGITLDLSDIKDYTSGYIQILINIDTEREIAKSYQTVVMWSVIFGIGMSVIGSIIISRTSIGPIAKMLKRQEDFVQDVSHELRTPLTIIQAKQELLLSDPNAKIVDKLEDISISLNETKRISKLTKDLMMLSRGDTEQLELNKEEIEIDEFISNIVKAYKEIIEIQNKKFSTDLNFGKVVLVDTNKIYQVIVILLDNAIKYTEERRRNNNKNIFKRWKMCYRSSRYRNRN